MSDDFLDHWGINPDNYDDNDDFEEDNDDDDFDPSSSALSAAERN
jgi:hypothetical protein